MMNKKFTMLAGCVLGMSGVSIASSVRGNEIDMDRVDEPWPCSCTKAMNGMFVPNQGLFSIDGGMVAPWWNPENIDRIQVSNGENCSFEWSRENEQTFNYEEVLEKMPCLTDGGEVSIDIFSSKCCQDETAKVSNEESEKKEPTKMDPSDLMKMKLPHGKDAKDFVTSVASAFSSKFGNDRGSILARSA